MQRNIPRYTLWVLCVDDEVYGFLQKLAIPNVRLLQLSKLETKDLLRVKAERTKGEYCWTLTPFAPRFVFESDREVSRVTYIDADLWFRKDPTKIYQELASSGKSVLITDHGYAPEYDQSATSGQFCVQFMIFERERSEIVRLWWEQRCIEWCYSRYEDGKFGDQKYLDVWPEIFSSEVHVLQKKEWALAPWNAIRFHYENATFYHFHGLRIINAKKTLYGAYKLPFEVIENIYKPYLEDLQTAIKLMQANGLKLRAQINLKYKIKLLVKRILFFLG